MLEDDQGHLVSVSSLQGKLVRRPQILATPVEE
jgi:hypothetical protein